MRVDYSIHERAGQGFGSVEKVEEEREVRFRKSEFSC